MYVSMYDIHTEQILFQLRQFSLISAAKYGY